MEAHGGSDKTVCGGACLLSHSNTLVFTPPLPQPQACDWIEPGAGKQTHPPASSLSVSVPESVSESVTRCATAAWLERVQMETGASISAIISGGLQTQAVWGRRKKSGVQDYCMPA